MSLQKLHLLPYFQGVSAIVVYIFINSELSDKLNLKTSESYTIFAIAFVAGFTERLMMRAIEHTAGK